MGWAQPSFIPVSMSSSEPTPCSWARIASRRNGTSRDGRLAERAREFRDARDRVVGGLDRPDHLHELHDGNRVEEVQPGKAIGPLRPGRYFRDRERRRVRAEDRLRPADPVERAIDLALRLEILDDGLDDEIGGRDFFE